MAFDLAWTLAGLLIVAAVIHEHRRMRRAIHRAPLGEHRLARFPSISVIRPVRGRDPGAEENFAAALDTGYPGEVDTLFVFDEDSDPGLPVARTVVEAHARSGRPGRASILVVGPPSPDETGKLHAMIRALPHTRGELIAFGDSDTRPDREVLRVLVEHLLTTPRAGCAFAPVVVPGPALTLGDAAYRTLFNGMYGPIVAMLHDDDGGLPFIMGQLMVWKREALAAIGGLACAHGQLVDDMYLGARLHEAGWRNVLVPHALPIIASGLSWREFLVMMRRWFLQSRRGLPPAFMRWQIVRGVEFWLGLILAWVALAWGRPLAAIAPAVGAVAVAVSVGRLQRAFGGPPFGLRFGWFTFAMFFVMAWVFAGTQLEAEVGWRGRVYPVSPDRRLATPLDPTPSAPTEGAEAEPAPVLAASAGAAGDRPAPHA